jgi:hypothetical protein
MRITWHVEGADVAAVRALLERMEDDVFVIERIRVNVEAPPARVSRRDLWYAMIGCLLTTQQRSGPTSAVSRFLDAEPFPLLLDACQGRDDAGKFVSATLSGFGGIRRSTTIGREVEQNLYWLESGGWERLLERATHLRAERSPEHEREAASFVAHHLRGFGPKQSRSFWQGLGLTLWEVPIDSRITKWLNAHGFPFRLSAVALSDPLYYDFVSDGFQELSRAAGVYPCVLDAAIFASFDAPSAASARTA